MTKIPDNSRHFGQCLKRWAPGFPGTYFHMIRKYLKLAGVANFNIEKTTPETKTSEGGGFKGLELNRSPILEPWNLSLGV